MHRIVVFFACLLLATLPAVGQEDPSALLAAGKYDEALPLYEALTKKNKDFPQGWIGLGQTLHGLGRYDEAVDAFDKAGDLGFDKRAVYYYSTRAEAMKGDAKAAKKAFKKYLNAGGAGYSNAIGDEALASLRSDKEFQEMLDSIKPCNSEAHRAFDFWVGKWNVTNQQLNAPSGTNEITKIQGGCAIYENYVNGNYTGNSVNMYDPARDVWTQNWIDNQGAPLYLEGTYEDGKMILSSDPEKSPVSRVTWTKLSDDKVRQLWEMSPDGGTTWQVAFDGLYERQK
ncbi:MAG: tetratricopeptide repeat protein [Acidobacteriota bacterium]